MYTNEGVNLEKLAVIVAHPDDETLWVGGTLLKRTFKSCFILSLCRRNDPDRAPRYEEALREFGATGSMADLNDGPDQDPLAEDLISQTIIEKLPPYEFDRIYTHSPQGEYTRHRRHEETGRTVLRLWLEGKVKSKELYLFAYEDGGKSYLPRPIKEASVSVHLPEKIWRLKYDMIREIYNFNEDSFEARTTPRIEAFWLVRTRNEALSWLI